MIFKVEKLLFFIALTSITVFAADAGFPSQRMAAREKHLRRSAGGKVVLPADVAIGSIAQMFFECGDEKGVAFEAG